MRISIASFEFVQGTKVGKSASAWLMFVVALLSPAFVSAQQPKATNLVTHAVDTLRVRTLANHHPLWANAANDLGALPADEQVGPMTLVLGRSVERQQAFEQLLADQQNPASPEYHHWLTPDEIGARFGVSDSDLDALQGWLAAENLQVVNVANSRSFIRFKGTAANIAQAFGTALHRYNVNGTSMLSVATEPTIPEALTPIVQVVRGLYEIGEHPMHSDFALLSTDPQMTTSLGNHYLTPKDFATIYNLSSSYTGAGFTVGIVAEAKINPADLDNYKSLMLTTFTNPSPVVPTQYGGVDPGEACTTTACSTSYLNAQGEATLDAMRIGSVAPGANMLLVAATSTSGGIGVDLDYMVDTTPVPVQAIDISWGACESGAGSAAVTDADNFFSIAAGEGISIFVSSGDSGASGCLAAFTSPGVNRAPSPNYLCSSQYVTCVGGTEFNDTANPLNYWNATSGAGYASALNYIPEGAWNESTASSVGGTGGGVSSYIATPTWQTGTGVPGSVGRYTPDVSFSGSGHDGYIGCLAAAGYTCVSNGTSIPMGVFSGTSASAPEMAGVAALVDEKLSKAQGNMNPKIYALANSTNYSSIFHDATVASSGVGSCSASTISLCNNTAVSSAPGYTLNTGFDLATGWGSLNIANFLSNYSSTSTPTVTVSLGASSITVGQTLTVTVTVSGSGATPTGSVILSGGGYTSTSRTLSGGSATINIAAGALAQGTDTLTATYTPDAGSSTVYTSASGTKTVTVTPILTPTVYVTPAFSPISVGQSISVTVGVTGNGIPPTGSVVLSGGGYTSASTAISNGGATFTIGAGVLALGTDTLTATYTPDASGAAVYTSATGSGTVTVVLKLTPTVTVTPTPIGITVGQTMSVGVTVTGNGGTATGSVVLSGGGYTSAAATLTGGAVYFLIPAGAMALGTDTLTAAYTPDTSGSAVYLAASGTKNVTVTPKYNPTVTVTPASGTSSVVQPLSVAVTVSGTSGTPSGAVVLSSGSYASASTTLAGGSATIIVPANSLALGTDNLTATFTPDSSSSPVYLGATGTSSVNVVAATYSLSLSSASGTVSAGTPATAVLTVNSTTSYTGSIALNCAVTTTISSPNLPATCSLSSATATMTAGTQAPATITLTITTTASTTVCTASNDAPLQLPWKTGGGAVLACVVLFGLGRRRRAIRNMLVAVLLGIALVGSLAACGSKSSGSSCTNKTTPGTTTGLYTVTVSGTGTPSAQTGSNPTFALTVN